MQFSKRSKPSTEENLAGLAAASLGSSLLLLGAFFFTVASSVLCHWSVVPISSAILTLYILQIYYLARIGKFPAKRRLRIWQASLCAHLVLIAGAWLMIQESVVFVLLLPEGISAVVHVVGIWLASKASMPNKSVDSGSPSAPAHF